MQLKRWIVLCSCVLHNGHKGVWSCVGFMRCLYEKRKGDLLVRSWAKVHLVCRFSVSSDLSVVGYGVFIILFGGSGKI